MSDYDKLERYYKKEVSAQKATLASSWDSFLAWLKSKAIDVAIEIAKKFFDIITKLYKLK